MSPSDEQNKLRLLSVVTYCMFPVAVSKTSALGTFLIVWAGVLAGIHRN